jgi:hypothetical protein
VDGLAAYDARTEGAARYRPGRTYGVTTGGLVQAVKRNVDRFPADFMFQLDTGEWEALRSQSVISNGGRGGRHYAPYAATGGTDDGIFYFSQVF